ncbi:spore coat protein CotF [Sporomusaceae bacterium BoRhaA]|uniref:spore coat protein n=1 Tax=Pelorhabdus rhamnosifermentans TaxID=2772457 RepID=UPI001C060D16|nr:spore coat protein [Pelorhabdus rhamnosifermentans]MBU2699364.1 spore coat protein CotF [Pelorhabdus rhamnosifermentans]
MPLSQKEKQLLQDQKSHEKVCIQKYQKNAQQTSDPKLKQLFQSYAQQEQQHLNTIESILNGQAPAMNQAAPSQPTQQSQPNQQNNTQAQSTMTPSATSQADAMLCQDMLMTEKYVSNAYNTAIFEFTDSNVRQALNHIQKEEQEHGEGIFNYMNNQGMYNVQ